jgi:hypothetical protein
LPGGRSSVLIRIFRAQAKVMRSGWWVVQGVEFVRVMASRQSGWESVWSMTVIGA